jgi:hypothetical protein
MIWKKRGVVNWGVEAIARYAAFVGLMASSLHSTQQGLFSAWNCNKWAVLFLENTYNV